MRYVLIDNRSKTEKLISYEEAKERISHYCNGKKADEMLSKPKCIRMMFSIIRVEA